MPYLYLYIKKIKKYKTKYKNSQNYPDYLLKQIKKEVLRLLYIVVTVSVKVAGAIEVDKNSSAS